MAEQVNLDLFMGDWYVIANIPTFIEKGAHNAVESYSRTSDKVIERLISETPDKESELTSDPRLGKIFAA